MIVGLTGGKSLPCGGVMTDCVKRRAGREHSDKIRRDFRK